MQNVQLTLRIIQGGIYRVSTRLDNPPGFNSDNNIDLDLMAGLDPVSTVALGHVVEYKITMCNAAGHKGYFGLYGDESGCALYDITATQFASEGPCIDETEKVQ